MLCLSVALLVGCSDKGNHEKVEFWPTIQQTEIDICPAWSPDGKKIIYFRNFNNDSDQKDTQWVWGVFLHDVESGADSLLWENFWASDFDWSPDGTRVAMKTGGQIYITNLARDSVEHIETDESAHFPRWSPCGDKLIFFIRVGINRGMYSFDTASDLERLILRYTTYGDWLGSCDSVAAISFDGADFGKLVVYSISDDRTWDQPYLELLKQSTAASSDGELILLVRTEGTSLPNIWRFDRQTQQYTRLTAEGGNYPAWSSDGQWIAFTKIDSLNGHLWLMRPDGSEKHQITF